MIGIPVALAQSMQTTATSISNAQDLSLIEPKKKAGFLRPIDEMLMLGIPTIGLFLCIAVRLFSNFGQGQIISVNDFTTLLTTLIFMDAVHVTFTFMMIYYLPELRQWSTSPKNVPSEGWDRGWSFWKRMAVIAAGLAVVVFVLKISPTSSAVQGMATIWLFLELVGPSQHTAAQMRGISFVYNSTIRKAFQFTQLEKVKAASAEKAERLLFKILIVGDVLYWIPKIFIKDQIHIPGIYWVQLIGGISVAGGAIGLLLNSFRYPKQDETDKTLFLTRVLLFPFKILTPVGGLVIRATHGSEYLLIFRRLVQSSSISEQKKKRAYIGTAIVSILYGLIFVSMWPGALQKVLGISPGPTILAMGLFITFVVRFSHYYMDAVIFKMSDPVTREAVSPLLVPAKK